MTFATTHRVGRLPGCQGLAAVAAGNQIVVQLDLNLEGILKVSAREPRHRFAEECYHRETPWPAL